MIEKIDTIQSIATNLIRLQQKALDDLVPVFDEAWTIICQQIATTPYPIIIIGLGKSGHIGHKVASTLASTGSPSHYIHATEAGHGDLGNIQPQSHVILFSFSGETQEVIALIPFLKQLNCTTYAITKNNTNTLAKSVDHCLALPPLKEACPHKLAPTTSTSLMLTLGDALAISLMHLKKFTKDHFALNHPSGFLGKKLCLHAANIMRPLTELPTARPQSLLSHALVEMSSKNLGCVLVINEQRQLKGIVTDGDLKRCINLSVNIHTTSLESIMTRSPHSIPSQSLAINALKIMQERKITAIPIVDNDTLVGLCHIHDILELGLN
ncbi:MAG TPA: KpsF/GutQ family sugar-phosphate isomerase [Gammaproteobacteria bacterium]|nr:KpsF/GutQ family sugar-phosphate isomerase [Gammaproteobacteria bacterium]